MRWIVTHRRHRQQMIEGSRLPSRLEVSTLKDLILVTATRTFADFDVWFQLGSSPSVRVAAGSVPGRAPGDWFHFKYTPLPQETLLVQNSVPTGTFADFMFLNPFDLTPRRSIPLNRNAIEAALVQSDLSRTAVDYAIGLLPDLTLFYTYLETKGAQDAIKEIRRLLAY